MNAPAQWLIAHGQWPTHAEQSAAARRLLWQLVGDDLEVAHDEQGAPYLPARPGLHISLSHCRTAVAAALSADRPVGIDIESRRRIGPGLAERICTPGEQHTIESSADPAMAFLQLWTRKEAVLKCRGTGIRGFGSMTAALGDSDITVTDLATGDPDTAAALAVGPQHSAIRH